MTNCLDAETIAAWLDGSLTERERAAAEAHAADCDRCLAVVAAMAKTAPPAQERVRGSWFSVRWLVPASAAVVALVAWVLVQRPPEPVRHIDTIAPPASEPAPPPAAAAETTREAASLPSAGADSRAGNPAPPVVAQSRKSRGALPRDDVAKTREEAAKRERLERLAQDGLVPLPKSAPAAPPAATITASPQGAVSPTDAAKRAVTESLALRGFASASAPTVVVSPDPNVRWRIAGVSVERSTDGGATWTAQTTGTQVPLLSGASPAPRVCWMVGQGGTVLLTIDGETWRRLDFPDPTAQLVAVAARDALSARVTTADMRTYHTDDGGKTWRLQETLTAAF